MNMDKVASGLAIVGALVAQNASAAVASWTDWVSASNNVNGVLTVGATNVNVTFSGAYSFAQTAGGTNYWSPSSPYLSPTVSNAPGTSDIIALNAGGTKTITFSSAVHNPVIGLVSWNSNTVDFGVPISFLSFGAGFWGNGTPVLNAAGTGFFGSGEVHGVIELIGDFTSISFNDTGENWHGITVGVLGLADDQGTVPEPASLLLLGLGLLGLSISRRKAK